MDTTNRSTKRARVALAARHHLPDERRIAIRALAAIAAATLGQILFLVVGCDWELCADEAEYWAWSRRLDWCYLAKGPLIAVVIRLGTALFGDLSLALTGDLMPAVRLPAVILGALTAWGVFRLAQRAGGARAGLYAALLILAVPLFRVGGLLMTIDTPLLCCWTWAAIWAYRAIADRYRAGWLFAGLLCATGVLAKYTMLAFPASVGFFLLACPEHRRELIRPGFWLMCGLCALGMAPIVAWNASHSGVASHQMADRVGILAPWKWGQARILLEFLGGEAAIWGVAWWLVALQAIRAAVGMVLRRPKDAVQTEDGRTVTRHAGPDRVVLLYLLCLWGVLWATVLAVCFLGENELNWAAPGYVSVLALCGWWLDRGPLRRGPRHPQGGAGLALVAFWGVSVVGLSVLQHTEWFYPVLARWVPASTPKSPAPLNKLDPTCRMRGHRVLVPEVARRFSDLKARGLNPFILTSTPYLASELTFYMPGHPEVYCLAFSYNPYGAVNQHDLWHPNPRFDVPAFYGRPALIVEDAHFLPSYADAMVNHGWFARAEAPERFVVRERGVDVAAWDIALALDYRGLPSPEHWTDILLGRTPRQRAGESGKNDPAR
ncbi:MAG TPA: glycosyltransferase family 39 protein [Isosphaeraceae bacterium]